MSNSSWLASVGVFVLLFGLIIPQNAEAQQWLRTVKVITPVNDGPIRALVDTLSSTMEREEGLTVQRSPDREEELSISELRDELLEEEGIGIFSASHVLIDYRFTITDSQFEEEIRNLHFIFRPGGDQEDLSIMYLDAKEKWLADLIQMNGQTLMVNEAAIAPFQRQLEFVRLAQRGETKIVEIGGRTVRDGFEEQKASLVSTIRRLNYQ